MRKTFHFNPPINWDEMQTDIYRSSASLSVSLSPPSLSTGGSSAEGGGQDGEPLSGAGWSTSPSVTRATPQRGSASLFSFKTSAENINVYSCGYSMQCPTRKCCNFKWQFFHFSIKCYLCSDLQVFGHLQAAWTFLFGWSPEKEPMNATQTLAQSGAPRWSKLNAETDKPFIYTHDYFGKPTASLFS